MDRNAISVPVNEWGTTKSKFPPDSKLVTSDEFTAGTRNIDSRTHGALVKRPGGIPYSSTAFAAKIQDQYEAIFSDGARHLLVQEGGRIQFSTGDTVFTQVGSGFAADTNFEFATTQDRVYFCNGINQAQVYDRTAVYGGVSYAAPMLKNAGAQAPLTAPSVAVAAGGSIPVGAHTYKITYLYYDGEESNGSPASAVATTNPGNQRVNLSAIPVGGYGVTARKIYRDNNDGVYVLVSTINDNTSTTFSDTALAGTTPIPTDQGLPPIFGLILVFLNRLFVGKVTSTPYALYFSEVEQPDIFPEENFVLCNQEDPITAIIVYQDKVIVFNRKSMGQILGTTSDQFRYSHIPGSVGCVDNRTVQIRTIDGIPVLVWLSDKGFYTYNGQSVNYISEEIEDVVNLNIQQAAQQKNQNTQTTQAQFQAGTPSTGIDLLTIPGEITTKGFEDGTATPGNNPKRIFDDQSDWDGGSTKSNVKIYDGTNLLKMPLFVGFDPQAGTHTGTVAVNRGDGFHVELPTVTQLAQETVGNGTNTSSATYHALAMKFKPSVSGTVATGQISGLVAGTFGYHVYSHDVANDRPLASIGSVGSVAVVAGTIYWLVVDVPNPFTTSTNRLTTNGCFGTVAAISGNKAMTLTGAGAGVWFDIGVSPTGTVGFGNSFYTITTTPSAAGGQWQSATVDSFAANAIGFLVYLKGAYPSGCSATLIVEGSNDNFGSVVTTQTFLNPNGSFATTVTGARYWRMRLQLSTTTTLRTPTLGGTISGSTSSFILEFNRTSTWISPTIDTTGDSTLYNALTTVFANFGGGVTTSVTVTIATSANPSGPFTGSGNADGQFGPFGSVIVRRYVQIKVVMTAGNVGGAAPVFFILSPTVTSILFTWTIVANLISAAIDTAVNPPAGWDVFQITFSGNVTVQQRSSATLIGLSSATFFTVTNGAFPPASLTPLRFTQWKVILTASADNIPEVDSVTVTWFISQVRAIRPASIFHDRSYFMSAASFGSTINDLLFEFDMDNKWRIHSGATISTFSFFFNEPYYGSASIFKIFKFGQGLLDDGITPIVFDARSKAFDFTSSRAENSDTMKTIQEVWMVGSGTGCTYTVYYSVDNGLTFIAMLDQSGAGSYTSTNDGKRFVRRFRADYSNGQPVSGRTLMWRIVSGDSFNTKIHNVKMECWVRNQRLFV